jgi:hypothetical protein
MKKATAKTIFYDPRLILTPEEKTQLRGIFASPIYLKMLQVVAGMRPSSNGQGLGSRERDAYSEARGAHRLSEMRGWDMYQIAVLTSAEETPAKRTPVSDTFPAAGTFEAEITPKQ